MREYIGVAIVILVMAVFTSDCDGTESLIDRWQKRSHYASCIEKRTPADCKELKP